MNNFVKLCQIVDTLKLHFYHGDQTTSRVLVDYAKKLSALSDLKEEAYAIKHSNNDMRYVNHMIGNERFRVMATTVSGFSITLQNNDVSISFKSLSNKLLPEHYPENYDFNTVVKTPIQPVIRVEFRASFLARVGHVKAIDYVVKLIERHFITDFKIKVSELHLATDLQGYSFSHIDYHRFRTLKKTIQSHNEEGSHNFYYQGRKFTGFVYGSGDDMLRIYNKTVEIKKNPDKAFIKTLYWEHHPKYDPYKEVWRIEIQYRREKLKTIYDDKNGLLDGFENVMASIPSLWDRALEKVAMVDLSDEKCLEHYLGYATDSNGVKVPLQYETITKRIYRAVLHPLWEFLKGWKNAVSNSTSIHEAPKTGAFQWVENSIKSLLSTMLKHYGDLSPKYLEDAFLRAEQNSIIDKGITLVDNAVNNTLDYLGFVIRYVSQTGKEGYVERDSFSTLQRNLPAYVREITNQLFDTTCQGIHDPLLESRAKILNKSLERICV